MMKNTDNEQSQPFNPEHVTIILDEYIEKIIQSILRDDEELGLDNYVHTDEYLRKLEVISDALTTGFDIIQQSLTDEKLHQGKDSALKRSELKASFKLVPGKEE
jgi:hypothetical protein